MKTESGKNISSEAALFFYDQNYADYCDEESKMRTIINVLEVITHKIHPHYFDIFYNLSNKEQLKIFDQAMFYELNNDDDIIRFLETRTIFNGNH